MGTPNEDIQQALIFASSYLSDACGGQSQRIIELPNSYETGAAVTVEPSRIRIRRLLLLPDV